MEEEVKRRLAKLEQQREEDRKEIAGLRHDMAELVAEMRVSNTYAKELYKRTERGEREQDEQGKAIDDLSKVMLKNQPAIDSVNKIKAGLLGVFFTVLGVIIINWFVATKEPPVSEKEYNQILEKIEHSLERLGEIEEHEH